MRKKLKQPSFAAGVHRDEVVAGAELLDLGLDEHIANVIAALQPIGPELGLRTAADTPSTRTTASDTARRQCERSCCSGALFERQLDLDRGVVGEQAAPVLPLGVGPDADGRRNGAPDQDMVDLWTGRGPPWSRAARSSGPGSSRTARA